MPRHLRNQDRQAADATDPGEWEVSPTRCNAGAEGIKSELSHHDEGMCRVVIGLSRFHSG